MKIQENKIKKEKLDLMKANDLHIKKCKIYLPPDISEYASYSPQLGEARRAEWEKETTPSWLCMPPV